MENLIINTLKVKSASAYDNNIVGGKAFSLINLKQKGFNVPPFVVVTTNAFKYFLQVNNIYDKVEELFINKQFEAIQNLIIKTPMDNKLQQELDKIVSKFGDAHFSVRSSAISEDSVEKSFAGQFTTFLSVRKDKVISSIKKCWASLFNSNVIVYQNYNDFPIYSMAVVVQEMINSDYAGVAFSIDPLSSTGNYMCIESVRGVGENLVSGRVTPSKFKVRKSNKDIHFAKGKLGFSKVLFDKLVNNVLDIEAAYNKPMDIEWCVRDDKLYILQARPITTVPPMLNYKVLVTRDRTMMRNEIFYKGEHGIVLELTQGLCYENTLFKFDSKINSVIMYWNFIDLEEQPQVMFDVMGKNLKNVIKLYNRAVKSANDLNLVMQGVKPFLADKFIQDMIYIYPFNGLGSAVWECENVNKIVGEKFTDFRMRYDACLYHAEEYLFEKAESLVPEKYKKYINFLTYGQVFFGEPINKKLLKQMSKGYIYFKEVIYVGKQMEQTLKQNKIVLLDEQVEAADENATIIKGDIACQGVAQGRAVVVFSKKDLSNFKKGDILVSPMTTPQHVEQMKTAIAIVTDEGGLTCHAAIVAREFNKPCIIAAKNATKIIKTGMQIKVDANVGMVEILK